MADYKLRAWAIRLLMCTFCILCGLPLSYLWAQHNQEELSGIKEGWGWPVVVVAPPKGWNSADGESIKLAMRLAERAVSVQRDGIQGKEVTFMFASVNRKDQLQERISQWRRMKVCAVISFAGGGIDLELQRLCTQSGPSVLYAGGENLKLLNDKGVPSSYLFALDLPYYAKANVFAALAVKRKIKNAAVFSDILSSRLAYGARQTDELMKNKKIKSSLMWVPAYQQDEFSLPVGEALSGGSSVIISWLEGMGTLSLWRKINATGQNTSLWYAGNYHAILLDAEGLTLVDKDKPLEQDLKGKKDIISRIRDQYGKDPRNSLLAAKAYALANWVIHAYREVSEAKIKNIADKLAVCSGIPLLGKTLRIDPLTHRPWARDMGICTVHGRTYSYEGSISVYSRGVKELP